MQTVRCNSVLRIVRIGRESVRARRVVRRYNIKGLIDGSLGRRTDADTDRPTTETASLDESTDLCARPKLRHPARARRRIWAWRSPNELDTRHMGRAAFSS